MNNHAAHVNHDQPHLQEKYDLHHYQRNADEFCSLCSACKKHEDVRYTFTDFRETSLHKCGGRVSTLDYMATKAIEDLPIPMVHGGVALVRFLHDVTHSQLLGTSKVLNGSILTYLVEAGHFAPFPRTGIYELSMTTLLRLAFINFKRWLRVNQLQATQARFTCSRLNRKHRGMFPALASKAINGKRITFWLCDLAVARAARSNATRLDEDVAVCVWSYCKMLKMFDLCGMVLSDAEAAELHHLGTLHLLAYARLRSLSSQTAGKSLLRSSFCILPKHHYLQHALDEALESRVNPGVYNLLAAEHWVGIIGRIARTCHRSTLSKRSIERYLCILRLRLTSFRRRL